MSLINGKLGQYIELQNKRNTDLRFDENSVRGVNTSKQMMPTKADLTTRDLSKFQIVEPLWFFFNHRTSRNGDKFSVTYNYGNEPIICTEDYVVFKIKEEAKSMLCEEWLYMFLNRPEFDRYVITNSWGSSTEFYNWEDICEVELELPPLSTQRKYVDIYNALVANQQSYERGLDDLKLLCEAYIEELRRETVCKEIGQYLEESDQRNVFGLSVDSVRGLATSKEMIPTKADMNGVSLSNYKTVMPGQIAFVPDTSRRGDKISLGYNDTKAPVIVSSISTVFGLKEEKLLPEYLMLFLTRPEFDRYARYHSWGSAREAFDWDAMCSLKIPIPDISVQRSIAEVFASYNVRKSINERLKGHLKDICPILIKGSIEEAKS